MRTLTLLTMAFGICATAHTALAQQMDHAVHFFAQDDYISTKPLLTVSNTFTIEMWINPTTDHEVDAESQVGVGGVSGQRYLLYPSHGDFCWGVGHAGVGISAGRNGVSVYEHGDNYMPAVLVLEQRFEEWTHIALVYRDGQPSLYVDGELMRVGKKSLKVVHPSSGESAKPRRDFGGIGGGVYGYYHGALDEFRVWGGALTPEQIRESMKRTLGGGEADLLLYYDMNRTGEGPGLRVRNMATVTGKAYDAVTYGSPSAPQFMPIRPLSIEEQLKRIFGGAPELDDHFPGTVSTDTMMTTAEPTQPFFDQYLVLPHVTVNDRLKLAADQESANAQQPASWAWDAFTTPPPGINEPTNGTGFFSETITVTPAEPVESVEAQMSPKSVIEPMDHPDIEIPIPQTYGATPRTSQRTAREEHAAPAEQSKVAGSSPIEFDYESPTAMEHSADASGLQLRQNYPNPFSGVSTISFVIPSDMHVTLRVYDMSGKEIKTLVDAPLGSGEHVVNIDATLFPNSGTYVYRLAWGGVTRTLSMQVVK